MSTSNPLPSTEFEFLEHAERLLKAVELNCDRINDESQVDIDNSRAGSMITISFEDKSQIIINLQKPLKEVWMATRSGGYHYHFANAVWLDTKSAQEFWAQLSRDASAQSKHPLTFKP